MADAAFARHHAQQAQQLVALVVRRVLQLGVSEEGGQHAEVGVAQGGGGEGQVEEVADDNVEEDAQVVGVEVFVGRGRGEEEVQQLEDEEL